MRRLLAYAPLLLRALAMALAALSVASGIVLDDALVAVVLAAAGGVVLGHRLAHTRLRTSVLLGAHLLLVVAVWLLGSLALSTPLVPGLIGTLLLALTRRRPAVRP